MRSIKTNTYKSFVEQVGKNISLFLIAGLAFGAYLLHEKYLIYITEEVSHRQLSSLRSVVSEPEKKFIASAKTLTEAYAILLNHNQSLSTDIQRINDAFHKTMIDNTDRIMSKFAKEIDIVHNISIRHQDIIDQFQQEKSKARNLSSSNEKSTADNIFVETENNTVTAPIIDQLFYADVDVNNIIVTFQSNELIEIKLCLNSFCKKIINPNFDSPINDVLRKYHRSGIAGGGFELETAGRSS
ncbi:hypothetical protein, partial [Umezakia ovalisporum]|uniref:hypothetical protein n=1 Tax=Umezakia ovalisporum TaxID=75695 RepID=UPI0039C6D375